jgi:hypothetical protein
MIDVEPCDTALCRATRASSTTSSRPRSTTSRAPVRPLPAVDEPLGAIRGTANHRADKRQRRRWGNLLTLDPSE